MPDLTLNIEEKQGHTGAVHFNRAHCERDIPASVVGAKLVAFLSRPAGKMTSSSFSAARISYHDMAARYQRDVRPVFHAID